MKKIVLSLGLIVLGAMAQGCAIADLLGGLGG